ncbi:MAG: GvpL/GvpF family gas vesicle protein [Pseudomonadota bacterium]
MSRMYCYAIAGTSKDLNGEVRGIEGEAVEPLQAGDHTIFASPTGLKDIPARRRFMKAHTQVLEALGEELDLLPMRFGTIADDAAAAIGAVTQAEATISNLLSRFIGRREWGVRIELEERALLSRAVAAKSTLKTLHNQAVSKSGSTQLKIDLGRRVADALEEERRKEQRRLLAALDGLIDDRVLRAPEHPSMLLKADLLVARCNEAALLDQVTSLSKERSATSKLVGPAPIYSFVDLQLDVAHRQAA